MTAFEHVDRWECALPPSGATFRVIRAEWTQDAEGRDVRIIREIERDRRRHEVARRWGAIVLLLGWWRALRARVRS